MEAALEITQKQTCGSNPMFSAAFWGPQALEELQLIPAELLCVICSKESSGHEGKESPRVAERTWVMHRSGQRKSWRKCSFQSQSFSGRAVFTQRFQSRVLQSQRAERTQTGGEGDPSKGSTTNDGSRAGKIHSHGSQRGPPLSFREVPLIF